MIFLVICTIISFIVFLLGLHGLSYAWLLVLFLAVIGFSYNAVRLYVKEKPEKKSRYLKMYVRGVLVFYFFFLFSLTFNVNRASVAMALDKDTLMTRLFEESNLIPFRTIGGFIKMNYFSSFVFINIVGNIGALMPLGILFPLVFPKARKLCPFVLMVTGVVLFIEFVQLFFGVGRLDVDDLILNVAGAVLVFGIYKLFVAVTKKINK